MQFDTYSVDDGGDDMKDNSSEVFPMWADFNTHYMNINIVNK